VLSASNRQFFLTKHLVRYDRQLPRVSTVSPPPARAFSWPLVYVGVLFTTLATLLLELSLTRIFSVIFYYHFAFLAISIALFGLGAGGVFSYVVAGWRTPLFSKLGWLSGINSLTVLAALVFLLTRSGDLGYGTLTAVYFASALPFFVSGTIVSLVISETIERVHRVYFFDLIGAAAGCLLLVPLLNTFGGPNTVIVAAMLFAAATSVWFSLDHKPSGRATGVALGLCLMATLVVNARWPFIDVKYAKGQTLRNERGVKWNSFSRIALAPEPGSNRTAIVIDADAATGIPEFDFENLTEKNREELLYQGPGLPYVLRPGAKTLIIGPGGGWDVSRSLASGSKDITGVEINPIIANTIMREKYADLSKRLYLRPEVHIHVEDGRSFVRRSQEKYQVLQATLVDTWASTAAGAFALSENNLYTTDAFYDYLSHLTDDGLVTFTRWGFQPPRESLRLISLAQDALAKLGEPNAAQHIIVARQGSVQGWGAQDTVIISRKPLPAADVEKAKGAIARAKMERVYTPGDSAGSSPFAALLLTDQRDAFYADYPFDVRPVSDDRPFFFYTVQPRDLWSFITTAPQDAADFKINRAVPLLFGLLGVSLLATALILALPPLMLGSRLPSEPGVRRFLMYFLFIGAGYILVEVALIQKFVLFLGHPTYALTVIIFSMLVASSLGSHFSRRTWRSVPGVVAILVALLAFGIPFVTETGVGWPLPVKCAVAALLVAPAAFLMGMPFPTGLRLLEARHKPSVRWAWSINAAASVLGSAAAIFFAIYFGLRATLIIGGGCYLLALGVSWLVFSEDAERSRALP
jgi:hypothetical protein